MGSVMSGSSQRPTTSAFGTQPQQVPCIIISFKDGIDEAVVETAKARIDAIPKVRGIELSHGRTYWVYVEGELTDELLDSVYIDIWYDPENTLSHCGILLEA